MEKGVKPEDFLNAVNKSFGLSGADPNQISPLTLAYVGDAVYELVVRTVLTEKYGVKPDRLNHIASSVVNAGAQSTAVSRIKDSLTEEEMRIYKRGRNARAVSKAKNARMSDYRRATGYEALLGYLFLSGRTERMLELIKAGLKE